jgi:riboflavin kinase
LHNFERDFYGATLSLVILGFIRPEYDYVSKEALVEDIREDIRVAERSLAREAYVACKADEWLSGRGAQGEVTSVKVDQAGQTDGVVKSQMMH